MSHDQCTPPNSGQQAVQDYLDDLLRPPPGEDLTSLHQGVISHVPENSSTTRKIEPENSTEPQTTGSLAAKRLAIREQTVHASPAQDKQSFEPRVKSKKVREPVDLSLLTLNLPKKLSFHDAPTPSLDKPSRKEIVEKVAAETAIQPESKIENKSVPEVNPETDVPVQVETAPVQEEVHQQEAHVEVIDSVKAAKPGPWAENGRPQWAQEEFECLLFDVAGLKLAVPLVLLGSIHRLDQELTPLVGRANWFMGLFPQGERNIQVVDTARWVMPQKYSPTVRDGYHFAIRLGDTNWGLACDTVIRAFKLRPDEVRWRSANGKRPWLAGTVIEHMCALLDVSSLAWQLDQAETSAISPFS